MKLTAIPILTSCMLACTSLGQIQKGQPKAYAFFKEFTPGTEMVDDKGIPIHSLPDTTRFLILEYEQGMDPAIDSVTYSGEYYASTVLKLDCEACEIGQQKRGGPAITLKASPGRAFMKIELQRLDGNHKKYVAGEQKIVIKGRMDQGKGKPFTIVLTEETELKPDRYG